MNIICHSQRLALRQFNFNDSRFIIRLLNEKSFIENIADKQVRTTSDAQHYLTTGPMASYSLHGFGLYAILLKDTVKNNEPIIIGMCGLLKRPELEFPDLGYALLPEFCGKGYAREAAEAVLKNDMKKFKLNTILAVTSRTNKRSHQLLTNINFNFIGTTQLYGLENSLYKLTT